MLDFLDLICELDFWTLFEASYTGEVILIIPEGKGNKFPASPIPVPVLVLRKILDSSLYSSFLLISCLWVLQRTTMISIVHSCLIQL